MEKIDKLICVLCQSNKKDDLKYGEFYIKDGIAVHYFCLLLTSNLCQDGKDDEGILGFLPTDIKKESERVKSQTCCYCQKIGANIGCCQNKCRRIFHLICGIENGAQNQFFQTFRSFCDKDVYKTLRKHPPFDETCTICYEKFSKDLTTMALCAPCCKNGWFHKWCLQEFANKAGYFFKCPLCNDNTKFVEHLPSLGIFIPKKDADWELEPNAFEDLLERPDACSAISCLCESGRKFTDQNKFSFHFCYLCGCKAIHKLCKINNAEEKNEVYKCFECMEILNNTSFESFNTNNLGAAEVGIYKSDNEDEIINIEDIDESERDILDKTVKLSLKSKCQNIDVNKNLSNSLEKLDKRSPSPKTSGTSRFHNLKRLDRPKFILTTVHPSIEKCVKKAFEKFELKAKKLFQKKLEMNSMRSECSNSSSNSKSEVYSKHQSSCSSKKENKTNFSFNKCDKMCTIVLSNNSEQQQDKNNISEITSDKSKITNHFRKRRCSTTSTNSISDTVKVSYHQKKQQKLINRNKDNFSNSLIENSKYFDKNIQSDSNTNNFQNNKSRLEENRKIDINCGNIKLIETNSHTRVTKSSPIGKKSRLRSHSKCFSSNDATSDNNHGRYETRSKSIIQNICNEPKFLMQNQTNFKNIESTNLAENCNSLQIDKNLERECSMSPTNKYVYLHNSRILKQNANNKLSPINRKVQSNKKNKKKKF